MSTIEKYFQSNQLESESVIKWKKKNFLSKLKMAGNDKSWKLDPIMPYIITFLCVIFVLSIIFAFLIYIRYKKTASQKNLMIDYKSSSFKLLSSNDQCSSTVEEHSNKSDSNDMKSCWFNLTALKEALQEFTITKVSDLESQRITNGNKNNENNLLIKEVQPIILKDESFYLGCANTIVFSPQSVGCITGYNQRNRAKNKGLLESRRGSRTSLTLSLSPSIDSLSSTRSPSPTRTDIDHEKYILENNSNYLSINDLKRKISDDADILFQEFWAIPMNHTTRGELSVFGMANKNRYKSILPNEHSRVILPQINDNFLSTYINANYIRDYKQSEQQFIATQGPMPQTIIDFWRLVWHVQASAIVMLTKLTENSKRKCEYYLPNDIKSGQVFGNIFVIIESSTVMEGFTVRKLIVKRGDLSLSCTHFWFTSWPDHGSPTPQTTNDLLSLIETLGSFQEPETISYRRPVIVHCSAGLGRTGCFIALCKGCEQLQSEAGVDVLGIVSKLRLDRGGMVNNNEQYEFLHKALWQFAERHGLIDNNKTFDKVNE